LNNPDGKTHDKVIQYMEKRLKVEIVGLHRSSDINVFEGFLDVDGKRHSITAENTIPAGAILTSKSVYGLIYATGSDRKCQMQQKNVSQKKSYFDDMVSLLLINNVKMLIVMVIACTLFSVWYDPLSEYELENYGSFVWLIRSIQNFMIYNGVIPLSLSINLMISRSFQAWWNFPSYSIRVNNSQLIGDLNSIHYLFSDKTGTLTKNEMVFQYLVDTKSLFYNINEFESRYPPHLDKNLLRYSLM
jgi:P-type E1-E2 ATPase